MKQTWMKRAALVLATATLAFGAAGCGNSDSANSSSNTKQEEKEQKLQTLRIGYLNVMDDAQAMLAKEAGMYKEQGIDAQMQMFNSGTDLIKAIVGGQIDAGVLGFTNALTWLDKGADIKIVGGAQMGYHSMLVKKDSGLKSLSDLKGKSIASQQQGSTADIVLNGVVLNKAGLAKTDVQMQYVSPSVAIQSLAAGKADAAFVFEPYASIARMTTPVEQIYEVGQDWPFPCMVVISSGKLIKENQDALYSMLDAQKDAINMLTDKPADAAKLIQKNFIKEDSLKTASGETVAAAKIIEESIKSQQFEWKITDDQVAKMQEISKMMVEQGILKKEVDVKQALDLSWQEQAK